MDKSKSGHTPIKVRTFLEKHGMTQKWLADQIGASTSLIRHYLDKPELEPAIEQKIRRAILSNAKAMVEATKGNERKFI
jgi:DNA transposition AAA+ family ATPase